MGCFIRFFVFIFLILFSFKGEVVEIRSPLNETNSIGNRFEFHRDILLNNWWWPWNEEGLLPGQPENKQHPFSLANIENLEEKLAKKIIGQKQAIQSTVAVIENYAHGLNNPRRPIGTLLYVGPTGVGKTELAKELSRILFGSEEALIRFNMSEFAHESTINRLLGSPRGYVDHSKGGELTNALSENPYSIVLLDEFEKASSAVMKVFLSLFDEGVIVDSKGRIIDCRNVLFILTSNLEGMKILTMSELGLDDSTIVRSIEPTLIKNLSFELYARMTPILFRGLKPVIQEKIINKMLMDISQDLNIRNGIQLTYSSSVAEFILNQVGNYHLGARPFQYFIEQTVLRAIGASMKAGYLTKNSIAFMDFQSSDIHIIRIGQSEVFTWHWSDEKEEITPPFNFEDLLNLEEILNHKVIGQPYAVSITVDSLIRYMAGLNNKHSPIGTFLYVGPTGVGKTQLAKDLATHLLGDESHLIRFDMSEFYAEGSVARLIGASPGYENHEDGGQLTEALKRNPYAIVLLDEIEKAHPSVLKVFLRIFDEGKISDSKGNLVDCRNVVFIATTNIGAAKILEMLKEGASEQEITKEIQSDITRVISPELYNRFEVAIFKGLDPNQLDLLIGNLLEQIRREVNEKKGIDIRFDSSIMSFLRSKGYDYELGARPLNRLIRQAILTPLAKKCIEGEISSDDVIFVYYEEGNVRFVKS